MSSKKQHRSSRSSPHSSLLPASFLLLLFFLLLVTPVSADIEYLYASDWTSTVTITNEANGYGAFDNVSASFAIFTADNQLATAALIDDFTPAGTFTSASFEIRMSSPSTWGNDYFDIQYWDSGTAAWYTVATSQQPGSTLQTFGPYAMPQIGSLTEVNATQVRLRFERVGGPDNIQADIDGVRVAVDYVADDLTNPTLTLNAPANDTWDLDGNLLFVYTPDDNINLSQCSLYFDGAFNQTNQTSLAKGAQNNFTLSSVADGTHSWYVNCSDTSGNVNVSETRTIKVDTTGPTVNLMTPVNGNLSSVNDILFWFNATDAQTTLASCHLIVNDSVKETKTSPAESVPLNFSITLTNALWTWWVNCTDNNGFTTMSEQRNITVNGSVPTIAPDAGSYFLGQTVMLSGENFNPAVGVTINYTLPNGTVISHTNTTTGAGTFMDYLFLDYAFPNGTYSVFAYETGDLTQNASNTFTVNLLPTSIDVELAAYAQGDEINITGLDFSPSATVNITIYFVGGATDSFLVSADGNGDFQVFRNLSYTASLGVTNVTGFDVAYPKFNATDSFTIFMRVELLTTDASSYLRDTAVNIYGYNFTRGGIVELLIYDNATDDLGTGFPTNKSTDDAGYFAHGWNSNGWCNGVYRVEAYDQDNTFLNDTAYFTIDETVENSDTVFATAGAYQAPPAARTAMNVSLVNDSDNQRVTLNSNSKTTWYFEFNFTNSYNRNLQIESVIFQHEHYETAGGFSGLGISYWNGSAYVVSACSPANSATDHNDTCDLSSFYSTPESLDAVSIRFTLTKVSGPSEQTGVDYAHLKINTSYQPSCTYFNGSPGGGLAANPPFVSSVLLEDGIASPANELDLVAGSTSAIRCNATVSDGDGYLTIAGVNATLYSGTVSASSPDNERNHYTNTSCSLVTGSGSTANYTCGFDVAYYAINGSWTCEVSGTDGTDVSMNSDTSVMNMLYALNISTYLLDYGTLSEGATSSELEANVSNIGNVPFNLSLQGYGAALGDGLSLNCTQENVTIDAQRYAFTSGAYASKTSLTSSFVGTGVTIPNSVDGTVVENATFWQIAIPGSETAEPFGACNGTIIFQADAP